MNLLPCLARLAQLQHDSVDRLALQEAAEAAAGSASASSASDARAQLKTVARHLQLRPPRWLGVPDAAAVRELVFGEGGLAQGLSGGILVIDQSMGNPVGTRRIAAELGAIGVQLIAAPWREDLVLRVAAALEAAGVVKAPVAAIRIAA